MLMKLITFNFTSVHLHSDSRPSLPDENNDYDFRSQA